MPQAARTTDATSHGTPLSPGPGSVNVLIGDKPAWRALPAAVAGAMDAISNTMDAFMKTPIMAPANAAADLAQISQNLTEGGAQAAVAGAPDAVAAASTSLVTLNAANVALTAAWTTASVVPGGQPAANQAYTEGIKLAAGVAAAAVVSAMAGVADMHNCPLPAPPPPHGPGFVTKGSRSVWINDLPVVRQNDQVMEACGGADPITLGCPTVEIGDAGGGGSAG